VSKSGISEGSNKQEAVFCCTLNNDGEVDLDEAKELMIMNIKSAFKDNVFIDVMIHDQGLMTDNEKDVVNILSEQVKI